MRYSIPEMIQFKLYKSDFKNVCLVFHKLKLMSQLGLTFSY